MPLKLKDIKEDIQTLTVKQIAEKHGYSIDNIYRLLRTRGVKLNNQGALKIKDWGATIDWSKPIAQIAREEGMSRQTIHRRKKLLERLQVAEVGANRANNLIVKE